MERAEKPHLITTPEGWDEMVAKYHAQEAKALTQLMEKKGVKSKAELEELAAKSIVTRVLRNTTSKQPSPEAPHPISATVIRDPQSKDVLTKMEEVRRELLEKTQGVFDTTFPQQSPSRSKS